MATGSAKGRLAAAIPLVVLTLALVTACSLLNSPPVASFTLTAGSWRSPAVVACDASASADSDGIIVKYEWSFGDGSTGSGESTSHTYTATGEHTVFLQVTDDGGKTASVSEAVAVLPPYAYEPSLPLPTPPVYPEPPQVSSSPLRFEGTGSPSALIPFTCEGGSPIFLLAACTVSIFDQQGSWIGFLEGDQKTCSFPEAGLYYLDVAAGGAWAITILDASYRPRPPQTYGGQEDQFPQYSSFFTLDRGTATFYIEYSGGWECTLVLLDSQWNEVHLLLRTYEVFDNRVEVDVTGGVYLLCIRASNAWVVGVEQ